MGAIVVLFWPLFLLSAIIELPYKIGADILGPFVEASEVWLDYFNNLFYF